MSSYDRSSPPLIGGTGWSRSSPSLTSTGSGASTPRSGIFSPTTSSSTLGPSGISWASAKAKSDEVRGYPSFSTRKNGFFSRQKGKISARLPNFSSSLYSPTEFISRRGHNSVGGGGGGFGNGGKGSYVFFTDDEILPGGKYGGTGKGSFSNVLLRKRRFRILFGLLVLWIGYLLFWTCEWNFQKKKKKNSFAFG